MTVGAWEHLVRDVLPRLEAERQLNAAIAASIPHMTQDAREQTIGSWQQAASTLVRSIMANTVSQLSRLRAFFRAGGINPDTGQENPKFR